MELGNVRDCLASPPVNESDTSSGKHNDVAPANNSITTSRCELWAFYLRLTTFGLAGFNFGPSQFQNFLYLAGYDPSQPPFTAPCDTGTGCVLPYLGKTRDINSVVLLTNGVSFAIQAVIMLVIGAWADYGQWRPYITIIFTLLAVAVSLAWLGVKTRRNGRSVSSSMF